MATLNTGGLMTRDGYDIYRLYREQIKSIELLNAQGPIGFRGAFMSNTTKATARIEQQVLRFRKGSEYAKPDRQHIKKVPFDLKDPEWYELAEGFTAIAYEQGIDAEDIRNQVTQAKNAAVRLETLACIVEFMGGSAFWDGTQTYAPPAWGANTFTTSHTHYLGYNAGGIPEVSQWADMKATILEHGYGYPTDAGTSGLVSFINTQTAKKIENKAEWNITTNYVGTPTIDRLQAEGLWPRGLTRPTLEVLGIPIVVDDWVPVDYVLMLDLNVPGKLGRWRHPDGPGTEGIIIEMGIGDRYKDTINGYRLWVSANVVHRSAGCVAYLRGASYVVPSLTLES